MYCVSLQMSLLAQALPPSPANQTRSLTSAQRAAAPKEKTTANAAAESEVSFLNIGLGMSSIVDKSTFSVCQLNRIEWLGIESK